MLVAVRVRMRSMRLKTKRKTNTGFILSRNVSEWKGLYQERRESEEKFKGP